LKKQGDSQKAELENSYKDQIKVLKTMLDELRQNEFKAKFPKNSLSTSGNLNVSVGGNTSLDVMSESVLEDSHLQRPIPPKELGRAASSVPCSIESIHSRSSSNIDYDIQEERTHPKLSEVRFGLEDPELKARLTAEELRENVLLTIERMVQLRYEIIFPLLESIVKRAPKEIMRRLVRLSNETKSTFPDVVDSMFQWGIDKERIAIRASTGVNESEPPILPQQYGPGVYFHEIKRGIEAMFKTRGIWGALMEVREWLQQILRSLEGEGRFRIYESNTLTNFWRLLFWANELWRCIVFEEEDEELLEENKEKWAKELAEWTGLVLKCDWRDYFIIVSRNIT
jgi:hypothetical protein